tara:strand:+ start:5253 stop:5561 length:309 start_codon:yes stop_codon:yes gene_type:complete
MSGGNPTPTKDNDMSNTDTTRQNASHAIQTAREIESWMLDADTQEDRSRTAHAIANAARETVKDLDVSLEDYADGFMVPVRDLRAMKSAMGSVLGWCVATMG